MRSLILAIALTLFALATPASARPHANRFVGPHPIATTAGGGFCYIEVPHIHAYAPDHVALFHQTPEGAVFVGDPAPFGYDGPRYTFYGNHPVVGVPGSVNCYIDGPHFHPYPPPSTPDYRMEKGVAFYIGAFPPAYYRERPHRVKVMQAEYRPYVAQRPVVEVVPPPEWHGEVWVPGPPTVEVRVPAPVVVAPAPHVYVTPPAPSIYVEPPAPRVYVGAPAPYVVYPHGHAFHGHAFHGHAWHH
jgi:hypothetical protein